MNISEKVYGEGDAEDLITSQLLDLQWKNEQTLRKVTNSQMRPLLKGKRPDYTLLNSSSGAPMAVIEAKKKGISLYKAIEQGLDYARSLEGIGCFAVFASDGNMVKSAHVLGGTPLMLNGEEVKEILNEKVLENFRHKWAWSRGEVVKGSNGLIRIFNQASTLLRSEGLANIDAFVEFSQILFIKIISEIYDEDDTRTKPLVHWRNIAGADGETMMALYRKALKGFRDQYGMFRGTEIKNQGTLERIVQGIDKYSFIDVNADVKGDAYEYFLRRYSKQKSVLGQYFTPRHVVRAMVILCNPRFKETICDPFCGTGGMLIESFKHIERNHSSKIGDKEREILEQKTVFGADISRSADAAKMNMILAGDGHSNIHQLNSLTDGFNKKFNKKFDVLITNIPFGNDELECIRHCMERVDESSHAGRLCIIVPERVLDGMQEKYVALRKKLLDEWDVHRVVSLPREVFRGVTSAKTSIIYASCKDKTIPSRKNIKIPYFKVNNDGYTLDKKRDPLPGENDLDIMLEDRNLGKKCLTHFSTEKSGWVLKPPEEDKPPVFKYDCVPLGKLVKVVKRPIKITEDMICREDAINAAHEISLKESRFGYNVKTLNRFNIHPGDLVFSRLHTQDGLFAISEDYYHCTSSRLVCAIDEKKVDVNYLFWVLDMVVPMLSKTDTTGREGYGGEQILGLPIPLPSCLEEQRRLVADVKQKSDILKNQATPNLEKSKMSFRGKIS